MRYEFIVKDAALGDVAVGLTDLAHTTHPAAAVSLFEPVVRDEAADAEWLRARLEALGLAVVEMRRLPD